MVNVKVRMTIEEALELAVQALYTEADERYTASELEDPQIAKWVQKRQDAASLIERQLRGAK